mgnify:CR=1 FL=1
MVITVEQRWGKGEIEKRWGPLSRTTAWRAGSFWEESNGSVKVFLDKDGKRAEVQVEKLVGKGGPRFWFSKKTPEPPQTQNQEKDKSVTETEDESITEEVDPGVDEVTQDEIQTEKMMWLVEKATSLEDENKELKRALQEMEAKLALQENAVKGVAERQLAVEAAISYFAEHIQRQDVFNESTRSSINGLVEEVKKHQDEFRQMATILQTHQQHIARTGTVSQEMAQYINALIEENEKKREWITSLMKETQAQQEVLRQHELGQQVLAEVIRRIANQQHQHDHQQGQGITGTGPIVTVVDDDDERLDFLGGQNPHEGPPIIGTGSMTIKAPRAPKPKDDVRSN